MHSQTCMHASTLLNPHMQGLLICSPIHIAVTELRGKAGVEVGAYPIGTGGNLQFLIEVLTSASRHAVDRIAFIGTRYVLKTLVEAAATEIRLMHETSLQKLARQSRAIDLRLSKNRFQAFHNSIRLQLEAKVFINVYLEASRPACHVAQPRLALHPCTRDH